jgi:N utilization substance protein A
VESKFIEFWQLSTSMLVALAKNEIKTLDDFAGLTTDDLIGYFEDKHDKNSRVSGMLDGFNLTRDEADQLILEARKIWLN